MGSAAGTAKVFQSTLSVRRATVCAKERRLGVPISIHALREESDLTVKPGIIRVRHFNPRSP